ncbi:MATE family efflux transporter [Vibrio ouci]|uniref:MATE family efflux transporter n=1 Tax=Vibrio ouci TaxID=2499078 RepID=A0A4Y8WGJ4_9VIBR|nr:MATE family efflux transporter [Vibrio ouci]TFH92032.1 MATE family efflux transporter [Vibrio ouci]
MKKKPPIYMALIKLALPLMFIQICQASLGLVDTLLAGQYHYRDLAAVGLASNIWTPIAILITGIMYALVPKFSAANGQQDPAAGAKLLALGKRNAALLSLFGFCLVQAFAFSAPYLIAAQDVAKISQNYLHVVAFAVPGLTYMVLYRFFNEGRGNMRPIALTGALLLVVNSALNLVLVNGYLGFPQLGGLGCGIATAITTYCALAGLIFLSRRSLRALGQPAAQAAPGEAQRLLVEGLPIGIALVLEVLALTALAFFASALGTKVVAAHQVAINIAMVVFMIPVAISSAATIQVSHYRGQSLPSESKRAGLAALTMATLYGAIMTGVILAFGQHIAPWFSDDPEVVALISSLILFIAMFQLVDAIQMVAAGILRGLEEFVKPLVTVLFVYWIVIIPISYFIGVKGWLVEQPNIEQIWLLLTCGLTFAALLLGAQSYLQLNKNLLNPELKTA